jgi:hypothetical protein
MDGNSDPPRGAVRGVRTDACTEATGRRLRDSHAWRTWSRLIGMLNRVMEGAPCARASQPQDVGQGRPRTAVSISWQCDPDPLPEARPKCLRRNSRAIPACPPCYFFFPLDRVLSFTVDLGLFLTVDCLTKRPVIALRPRLPLLDLPGIRTSCHLCYQDRRRPPRRAR